MIPASLTGGRATANGCACYRVTVWDRTAGGPSTTCVLDESNVVSLVWRWTLNTTSTLDLIVTADDHGGVACCDCVVRPWRDIVTVERVAPDGTPEGVVWQGPVTLVTDNGPEGVLLIEASDWSVDAARRPVARTAHPAGLDEADLWHRLFTDSLTGGFGWLTPGGWTPTGSVWPDPIDAASDTVAGTDTTELLFADRLRSVQWAVIARTVYGPGPTTNGDQVRGTLRTSTDWDSRPVVQLDGTTVASQVRLVAANEDDSGDIVGVFPPTPVVDPDDGLHILTVRIDGNWTQTELTEAAKGRWLQIRGLLAFVVSETASLTADAPVTVWDLLPGHRFTLVADRSCVPVSEVMQVLQVVVEVAPDATGCLREGRVAVDLNRPGSSLLPLGLLSD